MNDLNSLYLRAQAFVDRKYTTHADKRQKEMGLAYVEAERQDLAKEIARFTVTEIERDRLEHPSETNSAGMGGREAGGYRGFPSKEAYEKHYSDPKNYADEIPAMEAYTREAEAERAALASLVREEIARIKLVYTLQTEPVAFDISNIGYVLDRDSAERLADAILALQDQSKGKPS